MTHDKGLVNVKVSSQRGPLCLTITAPYLLPSQHVAVYLFVYRWSLPWIVTYPRAGSIQTYVYLVPSIKRNTCGMDKWVYE